MNRTSIAERDNVRAKRFKAVWNEGLHDVFVDVAPYYDRANQVASLGLWNWFSRNFMAMMRIEPGMRVLDVCAGTNAVGIALLRREPSLTVHAMDRSAAMQEVGKQRAEALGLHIDSTIGDVHSLPFPDKHFDMVTLQWASRHLRVGVLFKEIRRVLKPGGHFHHCDMLRPASPLVEKAYYTFLRFSLVITGLLYRSGSPTWNVREYFIEALEAFYTAEELSEVMRGAGFDQVKSRSLLLGMIGLHRAHKPE